MRDILEIIIDFEETLRTNPAIRLNRFDYFDSPANSGQLDELEASGKIEKSVLDFYRISDGFAFDWQSADPKFPDGDIVGRVRVNPFQQVMRNWQGVVYFADEPETSPRRKFFPLDFFIDEAAAGFCTLEGYRRMMYLFHFEGDLIPLDVTFRNYLRLMLAAKGCLYWHYLLLAVLENRENPVSVRIKRHLPALFPDFSADGFSRLVHELSLNAQP